MHHLNLRFGFCFLEVVLRKEFNYLQNKAKFNAKCLVLLKTPL